MLATETTLDAPSFNRIDPQDMLGAILGLPEQVDNAKRIALAADLSGVSQRRFSSLVITGLGGSAIGGDFLRTGYEAELRCPVTVVRDYHLPEYVNQDTLLFACSNSGNTEETLSCYAAARAARAAIVAFTTGGKLGELARAAVGYSFVPLIVAAARLGLMPENLIDDVDEASAVLRAVRNECGPEVAFRDNESKMLAGAWMGKFPFIYASQGDRCVVAYRWKTQINENANAYAVANVFPELNHNETVGWSGSAGQREPEKLLSVVILRDEREPTQIQRRVELTKQIVARRASEIREVWARGAATLSRMLSLVYLGDFASYYLAIAYGEDPTPVRVIDWLKGELAKGD